MAYSGKCACGNVKFNFEHDPMMHFMCHCTDCQVMFNGSFEGYAISRDELSIEGDLSTYTYTGGSELSFHVNFLWDVQHQDIYSTRCSGGYDLCACWVTKRPN